MKIAILLMLLSVLAALALAVYLMLGSANRDASASSSAADDEAQQRSQRMARALKWRGILSITLILFLLLAYAMGWIHPQVAPL